VNDEEVEAMQADTQNYSQATVNNGVSAEQPSSSIDAQNTLSSNNVRLKLTLVFHKNVFLPYLAIYYTTTIGSINII
jgi:hypothetical protein